MEKCIPGNLVGHGKTHWEVRRPMALRRGKIRLKCAQVAQVSPMSRKCRLCRACRANVAFIAQVSRCMHNTVDSTYNAICAFVRLLRIKSLQRRSRMSSSLSTNFRRLMKWILHCSAVRSGTLSVPVSQKPEITPFNCQIISDERKKKISIPPLLQEASR
jgi:hypothetical protein